MVDKIQVVLVDDYVLSNISEIDEWGNGIDVVYGTYELSEIDNDDNYRDIFNNNIYFDSFLEIHTTKRRALSALRTLAITDYTQIFAVFIVNDNLIIHDVEPFLAEPKLMFAYHSSNVIDLSKSS